MRRMSDGAMVNRLGLLALAARRRLRRALAVLARALRWGRLRPLPEALVIAPQDIRTADPTRALEIYAGRFVFAGKEVMCDGRSPFEMPAPSSDWARELLEFGWLRHLRAAETSIAMANARAFVDDWITLQGRGHPEAYRLPVLSRRLISWCTQSPLIIGAAEHGLYRRFVKSMARQTRLLRCALIEEVDDVDRLLGVIALCYAGLCLANQSALLKSASQQLGRELDRQILADGGHISRHPGLIGELLLDLLPLRQAFAAQNRTPPVPLLNAIDRMMPMMRFFRHGDGVLGQFNGMGATSPDIVATVLAYDDARGQPVASATHSGYERMDAGPSVVLMDVGAPPPRLASARAHAGCLSFEFSAERQRLIVNCGAPDSARDDMRRFTRATAAHSTAVVANRSSARQASGWIEREFGPILVDGPHRIEVSRQEGAEGITLTASHDGYLANFGIRHSRSLSLSADGHRLEGIDRFLKETSGDDEPTVDIRFHLHPSVRISRQSDGRGMLLIAGREAWSFSAAGAEVMLEDSIFLGGAEGARRTSQIVLHGKPGDLPEWRWSLARLGVIERPHKPDPAQEPELPF